MPSVVPSVESIRLELLSLGHAEVQQLATLSRVPFSTIWKIRDGTTKNPGIATVGQFISHVEVIASTRKQMALRPADSCAALEGFHA